MLETKRLLIKPLTKHDLIYCLNEQLKSPIQDSEPLSELMKHIYLNKLETILCKPELWLFTTFWQIFERSSQFCIGEIDFKGSIDSEGITEISYSIDHDYTGFGYISEALPLIIDWAFSHDHVKGIKATTMHHNSHSITVLQKLNFALYDEDEINLYWIKHKCEHKKDFLND